MYHQVLYGNLRFLLLFVSRQNAQFYITRKEIDAPASAPAYTLTQSSIMDLSRSAPSIINIDIFPKMLCVVRHVASRSPVRTNPSLFYGQIHLISRRANNLFDRDCKPFRVGEREIQGSVPHIQLNTATYRKLPDNMKQSKHHVSNQTKILVREIKYK